MLNLLLRRANSWFLTGSTYHGTSLNFMIKLLVRDLKFPKCLNQVSKLNVMNAEFINVFCLPTDVQQNCFKRILIFTLKQLVHVSVQSPSSGSVLFEFAKVIVIKIIS